MDTEEGRAALQEALRKLELWAARWGMEFNISKCKVMHFGRNNPRHDYVMNGRLLEKTEEERDLGAVTMSSTKPAAWCQRDKELLEIVQKRAVRMISGLRSDTKAD